MRHSQRLVLIATALLALSGVFALYYPGTSGALYYDDFNALDSLETIQSTEDAWQFATTGTAGPLGRPLALASFLPHTDDWPQNAAPILQTNVVIHLLNATLLALIASMLLRLRGVTLLKATWIGLGAATLWAVMPIIASASLIAIQRMTTLATFFGLLGIAGFIAGYWLRAERPQIALIVQYGALGLGTLMGLYTKESAALIPVFALLIDWLLLGHKRYPGAYQWLSRGLLLTALAVILFYLSPFMRDWFSISGHRGWSPWDRLGFQIALLWEYLHLTLAPLPSAFSPFHDHRSINDFSTITTLLASTAWISLVALSTWIYKRHSNPWLLFATLWFLTGHLLESTVINLELVFEHRNYLAVFGIALALVVAAAHAPGRWRIIAPVALGGLIAMNGAILLATTSLWGEPRIAAEVWAEQHPTSSRAAMHAATLTMQSESSGDTAIDQIFAHLERKPSAIRTLDRTANACPHCLDVRVQALLYACGIQRESAIRERFDRISEGAANKGRINISVIDGLFALQETVGSDRCAPIGERDLLHLTTLFEERPRAINTALLARVLFVRASILSDRGERDGALNALSRAEEIAPTALPILQFQVYLHLNDADQVQALRAIERRRPIDRGNTAMSDTTLDALERQIIEGEISSGKQGTSNALYKAP